MAVLCMRCGAPVEEMTQLCPDCAQAKREQEDASRARAAQAVMVPCPSCSVAISRTANFCPSCGKPVVSQAPGELRYAGFWIRFAASFIDGVFLVIINIVVSLAVAQAGLAFGIQILFGIAYTVGFWSLEGATPGKLLLGLRIVRPDGSPITSGQAFVRYAGMMASSISLGVGHLLIAFDEQKRGLQDRIATTVVVYADSVPEQAPAEVPAAA